MTNSETQRFEVPQYINSLIVAINDGAKSAQTGAFAFSLVGLYLIATAVSTTDTDLLLEHTTSIAQLGVQVPAVFGFAIAPIVFVTLHVFTLVRYDILDRNLQHYATDLETSVPLKVDQERCRQLLVNIEFVLAGTAPRGSALRSWLFRWVTWAIIAVFPVVVLLIVQISTLRYQSDSVNLVQRGALAVDLFMLAWFFYRRWFSRYQDNRFRFGWWLRWAGVLMVPMIIVVIDLLWLNPGSEAETVRDSATLIENPRGQIWCRDHKAQCLDGTLWLARLSRPIDLVLCPALNWGCRFFNIDHQTLVGRVWKDDIIVQLRNRDHTQSNLPATLAGLEGVPLRNRTLRLANLDQSSLYSGDLTFTDLRGAILWEANLQGANLFYARLQNADLSSANMQEAYLRSASLQGARLRANLEAANLSRAHLEGADMRCPDPQDAPNSLSDCTHLELANLTDASLEGADLRGAHLEGANLTRAHLEGADLSGAHLEGADLRDARLAGADLSSANLEGARLRGTQPGRARLQNTAMALADLRGADFSTGLSPAQVDGFVENAEAPEIALRRIRDVLTHPATKDDALSFSLRQGAALADKSIPLPPLLKAQQDRLQFDNEASYNDKLKIFLSQLSARNPVLTLGGFDERRDIPVGVARGMDDPPAGKPPAVTKSGDLSVSNGKSGVVDDWRAEKR